MSGAGKSVLALSASELAERYAAGELSPVEVIEEVIAASAIADQRLAAISYLDDVGARQAARQSADRWSTGAQRGALDGVPVTLKDSFHTAGLPRWHGSACHETTISSHDAAPVKRLREAGAVIVAKTTMPDFAMLMSGLSSRHGVIRNPWDPDTSPGGSSSGAGACLASGVAPLALGTDMVGSVRVPAALCGVVALCPTRGRIAYDPPATYRSAGPMTRSVDDAIALLEVVGQHDPVDHFSLPGAFRRSPQLREDLRGVRVGVITDLGYGSAPTPETVAAVSAQVAVLVELGAEIDPVPGLPVDEHDYEAIYVLMTHKGLLELHSVRPSLRGLLQPEIAAMLEPIYDLTALAHGNVMSRLDRAAARVSAALDQYDYIISPTVPVPAFPADQVSCDPQLGAMSMMAFVCWFNQIGAPAGCLPAGLGAADGPPLSVQVAGRRFDDGGVLEVMALLESRRGFAIEYPLLNAGEVSRV
jgi:aspartyl-tRNA(Asn)/glutamyl-tRNA(Gln) amidotransferase subunit A